MSAVSWVPVISSVVLALFFGAVLVSEEKSSPTPQATSNTGDKKDGDKKDGQATGYIVPEFKNVQDAVDELNKVLRSAQMVKDEVKKADIITYSRAIMVKVRGLKGENQTPAKEVFQKIMTALGVQTTDLSKLTFDQLMDGLGKKLKEAQAIKAGGGTPQDKIAKIKNLQYAPYFYKVKEIEKNNPSKVQAAEKVKNDINAIRKDLGDTTIGNNFAQGKGNGNKSKNAQGKGGKRPFNQNKS